MKGLKGLKGLKRLKGLKGKKEGGDNGDGQQGPFKGRVYHRFGRKSVRKVCETRQGGCAGG